MGWLKKGVEVNGIEGTASVGAKRQSSMCLEEEERKRRWKERKQTPSQG